MSNNNTFSEDEEQNTQFITSIFHGLLFAYTMALGDFDADKFGEVHVQLVTITFVIATLFLTIVMLNLLVAVISDTYARVEETSSS